MFRITILLFFLTNSLNAQFPSTLQVDAKGTLFKSSKTLIGAKYKIRVEGTFSILPQFSDCKGFDATYVYEAPKEEIDNFRWPPEEIDFLGNKIEIFKLPKWVGDPTLYQFPPPKYFKTCN